MGAENQIFISYAHEDVQWKDEFALMLSPAVRRGKRELARMGRRRIRARVTRASSRFPHTARSAGARLSIAATRTLCVSVPSVSLW